MIQDDLQQLKEFWERAEWAAQKTFESLSTEDCEYREVISTTSIYCKKRGTHRAYRNNCFFENCPVIHEEKDCDVHNR